MQTPPPTQTPRPPSATPTASPAPAAPPYAKRWQISTGTAGPLTLVATARVLLVCGGAPSLVARSVEDGVELWKREEAPTAPPTGAGGLVFFLSGTQITAADEMTGVTRWHDDLPAPGGAPVSVAGWLFVASGEMARAYRAADGTRLWDMPLPAAATQPPVVDGDRLYLALANRSIVAIDINAHVITWTIPLAVVPGPLLAANARVYFGGDDGTLYAYDQRRPTADPWGYRARVGIVGAPVADTGHVFVALLDNTVRVLDAGIGTLRWPLVFASRILPGMVLRKDVLVVPLTSAEVGVADATKGRPIRTVPFPKPADAPPGFFYRMESVAATADASRIFLAATTFLDERTVTALDFTGGTSAGAGRAGGSGRR